MANIMENQASTQSTLPQPNAAQAPVSAPPVSAQTATPEMQAVWAELAQIAGDPVAMKAKATQFGMGEQYDGVKAKIDSMQARAQELMAREEAVRKEFDELAVRAKSASSKMMAGVVAAVIAGGFLGYKAPRVDSSATRKSISTIAGLFGGGVIGGLVGRIFVGSKIQKQAKDLMQQSQQIEIAKEQMAAEAQSVQQPFIMALVDKMAAARKQSIVPPITPPEPPVTAPAPSATPPSAETVMAKQDRENAIDPTRNGDPTTLIDDTAKLADQSIKLGDQSIKLGDQSITPPGAAALAAGPKTASAGIQPRGAGFADAAAKEQLAGVGAVQGR